MARLNLLYNTTMAKTKQKGDIAEAKVLSYLISKGYKALLPWGEDNRYDLVCEAKGVFKKIQVKYVTPKNGALDVPLRSANNWNAFRYSNEDVDLIAAYNPENDKVYFISLNDFKNVATIKLRLARPKNSQQKLVKWAADFEGLKKIAAEWS